ncbi:hypothetical protein MKW94_008400 [Papaver nudicaule]|uniref:Uncharacterized protein n=1 Tax=Papaver nudicaule TaxID=74823 RepID=A0AA41VE41_PAPNU|nr:hypothetical protein [Papaver nudicaule]
MAIFCKIITNAIAPLATRTRKNYSSYVLITTTPLKNSTISCGCGPYREVRFSSLAKKRPTSSYQVRCAAEKAPDVDTVLVETPSEFPFNIEDKPGDQTVILTRYCRWDHVRVVVHMPNHHSSTTTTTTVDVNNEEKSGNESDRQSSIRLVVTSTNFKGTTLEYGVIAYPDDFSIDSFCVKYANSPDEENIYYIGTDYAKLDKDLQKEFKRYLKLRGIIPSTTKFLHEYMANRDMYSSDSSKSYPTTTTTNQSTPESLLTPFLNEEGIPADPIVEQYRKDGHPLVSIEDIRNSGKHPDDFVWFPYPYHRTEKLLYIEVPTKGLYISERELEVLEYEDDSNLSLDGEAFVDGEAYQESPYRCLPRKAFGDPPVISEEIDKILYPDLKHATDPNRASKGSKVALQPYYDAINKMFYPHLHGRGDNVEMTDEMSAEEREWYQVYCM